jgi:hypothetical protein
MKAPRNKYYLLNFVFVICVLVLCLNDHYLKFFYSNELTGKLSDAAGIILLPLLVAFVFPRVKLYAIWLSALVFAFWKSDYSQGLLDFYNSFSFIQTSRVVDYTDLYVLFFLPIPHFIIKRIDDLDWMKIHRVNPIVVLLPTIFILMSTSPPRRFYYERSNGNLKCYNCKITVNYNQDQIIEKLRSEHIVFDSIAPIDSFALWRVPSLKNENAHVYRLNELIIDKDTLRKLDFTMRTIDGEKTKIYFTGMQVSDDISTWELQKKLRNYYEHLLFKELKSRLKK